MIPYVLCFLITGLFSGINERLLYKKKRHIFLTIMTAAIVILLPAILAGLRDYSIGTDVELYVVPTFDAVNGKSVSDLGQVYALNTFSGMIEIGFFALAYISSFFSDDPHIFLFFIAAVIGVFTYLSLYRIRKFCSILMGELVFLLLFYAESYNMMRQCLAMSISIFALTYLFEKKYKIFIMWVLIAFLFHRTAILAFLFLGLYLYLDKKHNHNKYFSSDVKVLSNIKEITTRKDFIKIACIMVVFIIVFVLFKPIIAGLITLHILPSKYIKFISDGYVTKFSLHHMFDYAFMYVFLFLNHRKVKHKNYFFALGIIDVILYMLRYKVFLMYRISRYFMYCRVLSLSQVKMSISNKKISQSFIYGFAIILLCLLYWYEVIVVGGYNDVVPYTSSLLGIG